MAMERVRHALTRRGLIKGVGVATAATAAVATVAGCSTEEEDATPEPMVVDEEEATSILEEFEEADFGIEATNTWSLPLGSVLHEAEGTWIPVTQAGASAAPMVIGCAMSLEDGSLSEVVSEPIGTGSTIVIYDVRCSDFVYAWVELDYLTRDWTLYASSFSDGALTGSVTTLWSASSDYEPAPMACTGSSVIWQIMPSTSGSKTSESSACYLWKAGDSSAKRVIESPGRFATVPTVSGSTVTMSPRVRADEGTYYGITAYSLSDDLSTIVDQLVLPASVRPFRATRVGDRFCFSVEATYSDGGLFAGMGTYIGASDGPFVYLGREPRADVVGSGDLLVVKSTASYFLIDLAGKRYDILAAANRCLSYGEYPARVGEATTFVTFATVKDADTGYPASVTVRTFDLQLDENDVSQE